MLSFALATAVWASSRTAGIFCFVWALFVVCLPRAYLGFHYPSDLVLGASIGVLATLPPTRLGMGDRVSAELRSAEHRMPALFHIAAFTVLFQFLTMFADLRSFAKGAGEAAIQLFRA